MTILPGSLDYLYYNGITPCIPYQAYEMLPMTNSGIMEMSGQSSMPQAGSLKGSALGIQSNNYNTGFNSTYNMQGMNPYSNGMNQYSSGMGGYSAVTNGYQSAAMNGSQYLDLAMQGGMYGNYTNSYDSFSRSSNSNYQYGNNSENSRNMYGEGNSLKNEYNYANAAYGLHSGIGTDVDYEKMANDEDGKNLRVSITNAAKSAKEGVMNAPSLVKGLAAAGIILGTVLLFIRKHTKPAAPAGGNNSGFWSKLNPKNWFKK